MNSELKTLRNALASMAPLAEPGTLIPRFEEPDHDLAMVATALLRKAYVQASAIAIMAESRVPEAAIPNLRSILEAYGELNYLVSSDEPIKQAQIAFIYALREFRDFNEKWGEEKDTLALAMVLKDQEARAPEAFAEACRRKNFWTTVGRAQLVEAALDSLIKSAGDESDNTGRQLYKLLSWDDHHVMATILVMETNPDAPHPGTIKVQEAPESPETFLPLVSTLALFGMLELYFRAFPETRRRLAARQE